VPDFFPMAPLAIFYLAVSLLYLVYVGKVFFKPKLSGDDEGLKRWAATYGVSRRELEVLRLLREGKDNKTIAYEMSITPSTVKVHLTHLFQKTGTQSRFALVRFLERPEILNSTKV